MSSHADHHELHQLELSWFGEITCSPRTHRDGEKIFPKHGFPYGNKIKRKISQEPLP